MDRELFSKAIDENDTRLLKELAQKKYYMENIDDLIIEASLNSNVKVVEILLQHGFKTNYLSSKDIARIFNDNKTEIIKLLLDYADDYSLKSMIFTEALAIGNHDIIKYCLINSLIKQTDIIYSLSEIRYADFHPKIETVKLLLDSGAEINCHGNNRALAMSCYYGYVDIVVLLLNNGADPHIPYNRSLIYACENGHLEIVKILLEYGLDINSIKYNILQAIGCQILFYYNLRKYNYLSIIRILFEYGANPNSIDALYILHICCIYDIIDIDMIKLYLSYNFDPNSIHKRNERSCIFSYVDPEIKKLLIEYGYYDKD